MKDKLFIAVAPNGARRTKADHPHLPIAPDELAQQATSWVEAGASLLHLHVRNSAGQHLLDYDRYGEAIFAIRDAVKDRLVIQITTEAVGVYQPQDQINIVKALEPESATVALREITSGTLSETILADFYLWAKMNRVVIQHVIYNSEDMVQFGRFLERGIIPGQDHAMIVVLGKYDGADAERDAAKILRGYVDQMRRMPGDILWFVCAFGQREAATVLQALPFGGHIRVGFENNLHMPDGALAPCNAALIETVAKKGRESGASIGNSDDLRARLAAIIAS